MGREIGKEGIHVYMGLMHFIVQLKQHGIVKKLYSKKKKKERRALSVEMSRVMGLGEGRV